MREYQDEYYTRGDDLAEYYGPALRYIDELVRLFVSDDTIACGCERERSPLWEKVAELETEIHQDKAEGRWSRGSLDAAFTAHCPL